MNVDTEYIARVLRVIAGDERHLRESPDWWIVRAAERLDELSKLEQQVQERTVDPSRRAEGLPVEHRSKPCTEPIRTP